MLHQKGMSRAPNASERGDTDRETLLVRPLVHECLSIDSLTQSLRSVSEPLTLIPREAEVDAERTRGL